MATTTVETDRHLSLDALRGFAVMGILLLNIISFSMPEAAYINPGAYGGTDPLNITTWFVNFVVFDGKMRGLFSMLFGASMLLIMERAALSGDDPRAVHFNRMAWLFVFGTAHFILLWWGDILIPYAMCGVIAVLFVRKQPLALVKWAFGLFAISFLVCAMVAGTGYFLQAEATAPGASAMQVMEFGDLLDGFGRPGSSEITDALALYQGDYAGILNHNLANYLPSLFNTIFLFLFDTLGMMLLGMAMLKSGFLTGQWAPETYARTARHCFIVGIPPMMALAAWVIWSDFDTLVSFSSFLLWSLPFRIPLTVGWAALLLLIITRHRTHPLLMHVAAAGRTAFSNYLGTSMVMTTVFYGYGLGLYGQIDRMTAMLFVFAMWALIILWSKPWLDRFYYGPLEWLWRSLARRAVQPFKR